MAEKEDKLFVCPRCGAMNSIASISCYSCGYGFTKPEREVDVREDVQKRPECGAQKTGGGNAVRSICDSCSYGRWSAECRG